MDSVFSLKVLFLLILLLMHTEAFPQSGIDTGRIRTQRDVNRCRADEYQHGSICCSNCPAGTHMESPCTTAGQMGTCKECDHGRFTEHGNGLKDCLTCTQCRPDQEMVTPCTSTANSKCQCKPGRFCAIDQACEVCKKCSRCEKDEEIARNCTATTNTECKRRPNPGSTSTKQVVFVTLGLISAVIFVGIVSWCWWKKHRGAHSQISLPSGVKSGRNCTSPTEKNRKSNRQLVRPRSSADVDDERKVLCESLSSSASNSQHSLTSPPAAVSLTPLPRAGPVVPRQPDSREEEQFPVLIPVNDEASLRKCFEYFEEMEIDYYKRVFRHLGIHDNLIKSKEFLPYEDRIHDLLNIWVEMKGRDASLNDLLRALLVFNQRRTAEIIMEKAVQDGHYFCEKESQEEHL